VCFSRGADNKEVIIDRPIGLATNYETYQRNRQSNQTIVKAGGVNAGGPSAIPLLPLGTQKKSYLIFIQQINFENCIIQNMAYYTYHFKS